MKKSFLHSLIVPYPPQKSVFWYEQGFITFLDVQLKQMKSILLSPTEHKYSSYNQGGVVALK